MEAVSENTAIPNEIYSFEISSDNEKGASEQEGNNYLFDELNPAKLIISDIVY